MPDLITEVGTIDANSYATLEEADAYHETRLHNTEWTAATEDERKTALIWATRVLDRQVDWIGRRWGLYDAQALEWPRSGAYDSNGFYIDYQIIPRQVKDAQAELAWLFLREDRTASRSDSPTAGIKGMKVGPISLTFDPVDRKHTIPDSVVRLLQGLSLIHI